jgi:hypothetical protein
MGSCSSSASTSAKVASLSTWSAAVNRRLRPGEPFWKTISRRSSRSIFTVPAIRFQVLYVFLVLAHDRRRVIHFNLTTHPTAQWTAQQLREAFPFDQVPLYLPRDRDAIFGLDFSD